MKSCDDIKPLIEKYIGGKLNEKERLVLDEHTAQCGACREIVELHNRFAADGLPLPLPAESSFKSMRKNIIDEIEQEKEPFLERFWRLIGSFFAKPAVAVSLALGMFVFGIFIPRPRQSGRQVILGQIKQVAYTNKSFKDVENSPYIFQNVRFKPLDNNRVALRGQQ